MGLVKVRRLAAMQKQQRAKAGMKPACTLRRGVSGCDSTRSARSPRLIFSSWQLAVSG